MFGCRIAGWKVTVPIHLIIDYYNLILFQRKCLIISQEGDMPIEQLLAMYGCGSGGGDADSNSSNSSSADSQGQDTRSSSEEEILSNQVQTKMETKTRLLWLIMNF